jgi:hypothetical protein
MEIVGERGHFLGQDWAAVTHRDGQATGRRGLKGGMDEPFAADPDAEPETRPGTVTLECRALRMTYAHLRIRDPGAGWRSAEGAL